MKHSKTLRILSFGIGLLAVVILTVMNVVSLYELRESTLDAAYDNKKNQIEELTHQVRHRLYRPAREIRKMDMAHLKSHFDQHGELPGYFNDYLKEVDEDPLFGSIYYSPYSNNYCRDQSEPIFHFSSERGHFVLAEDVPARICDGLGLARSQIRVLLDEYRWNNKVTFDTHRTITMSLIILPDREVLGHLTMTINPDYLVDVYLKNLLRKRFGPSEETGLVVWVRDFMLDEILASSDPREVYDSQTQIDIRQRFPDFLDNWVLHAKILESPTANATDASLSRNLLALGFAVLSLLGALIFMYFTAKRERDLAQRQAGFLANVTHELKTPLATMQAAGENLSDGRVTNHESIRTYGEHIYNESIRLKKMIEKLLDIARIDSGQTTVQLALRDPELLLDQYYRNSYHYVTSKGFSYELSIEPHLPHVLMDEDQFQAILANLVDNAIKYSFEKKHIALAAERAGDKIVFKVSDHGIGIPKKLQKQVFRKFFRIEDALTAKTKGHGLGLSIVKNLVSLNRGDVSLESTPGHGTTFRLEFPIASTQDQKVYSESVAYNQQITTESQSRDYVVE